jgi:hypothetical protein
MTEILILSALFQVCLTAGLLVLVRRSHNRIHKLMHARVTALMDFAPDSNGAESYGNNSKGGNPYKVNHQVISKFDA